MERTSVSNNLEDKNVGSKTNIRECNNTNKHRNTWNLTNSLSCREDYFSGFSWAPRSYTCSFCKREFRSAQALGGHMNVHRRERARLRLQSPPRDGQYPFLNLNLNPNPKTNIAIPPLVSPPFGNSLPSSASPVLLSSISSSPSASPSEMKKWGMDGTVTDPAVSQKSSDLTKKSAKSFFQVKKFDDFMEDDGYKLSEKAGIVGLDYGIGLTDSKEDLDLELRLGYS